MSGIKSRVGGGSGFSLGTPSRITRSKAHDTIRKKVEAIFGELPGESTARLSEPGEQGTRDTLVRALSEGLEEADLISWAC
jgi:hypothetical protein